MQGQAWDQENNFPLRDDELGQAWFLADVLLNNLRVTVISESLITSGSFPSNSQQMQTVDCSPIIIGHIYHAEYGVDSKQAVSKPHFTRRFLFSFSKLFLCEE